MSSHEDGARRERLPRSGTTLWPLIGYLTVGVFVFVALVDGFEPLDAAALAGCALMGSVVFVVLQRPAADVDAERLHLRGMLSTVHIPLAAVERVAVQRVLAVFAGEHRFVSPSVQRSLRSVLGKGPRKQRGPAEAPDISEADLVEQRISQLAEDARARVGVRPMSEEQLVLAESVSRSWSASAIALLAVPAALLVALVLAFA